MNRSQVLEAIGRVPYWRHIIDLPFGVRTPGRVGKELIERLALPPSLAGLTVLDIGTFDGLCAFEAEARGARRVLGIDTWHGIGSDDPDWWRKVHTGGAGFQTAKRILESRVESMELSVYELEESKTGRFDYVLMCGLVYHLRDPLQAIERALRVTDRALLIESAAIRLEDCDLPIVLFCRGKEGNPSNWWQFSAEALRSMCCSLGASEVTLQSADWYSPCRRFVAVRGVISLYDSPAGAAKVTHTFEAAADPSVRSHRFTFRDGYYWLRISSSSIDNELGFSGWLRFRLDAQLPVVREEPVPSAKKDGRIVLRVRP